MSADAVNRRLLAQGEGCSPGALRRASSRDVEPDSRRWMRGSILEREGERARVRPRDEHRCQADPCPLEPVAQPNRTLKPEFLPGGV